MAQKRMLDKKISISEQLADLTTEAQLLFTWMIPHSDDAGLLPFSPRSIKGLVVPMKDWTVESISFHLESIRKAGLIDEFEWEGDKFWHLTNFLQHQSLKRDRKPQVIAKNIESWNTLLSIWKPKELKEEKKGREVYEDAKNKIIKNIKSV